MCRTRLRYYNAVQISHVADNDMLIGSNDPWSDCVTVARRDGSEAGLNRRLVAKPPAKNRFIVSIFAWKITAFSIFASDPFLLFSLSLPKSTDTKLANIKARMFNQEWLNEPDAEGHFPTNGDRFAAQEIHKKADPLAFTTAGFIMQAIAAGWHHKSPAQVAEIGDRVGRERIQVIHGDVDRMITFPHGEVLAAELGGQEKGVTVVCAKGKAHGLPMEWRREFTKAIAALVERTNGK